MYSVTYYTWNHLSKNGTTVLSSHHRRKKILSYTPILQRNLMLFSFYTHGNLIDFFPQNPAFLDECSPMGWDGMGYTLCTGVTTALKIV